MMTDPSILFLKNIPDINSATQPSYFPDLNLDQIMGTILDRKNDYNLQPFFYTPMTDIDTICYRQDVFRDLNDQNLLSALKTFADNIVQVRRYLSLVGKLDFHYHKEGWFLEAVITYCQAVLSLKKELFQVNLASQGLLSVRAFLEDYVQSTAFQTLYQQALAIQQSLAKIRYCIILQNGTVRVRNYEGEIDYSEEILKTFAKFKQGAVKDYRVELRQPSGMNHIEAKILEFVARLNPTEFKALDHFCEQHPQFIHPVIQRLDREMLFYISYLVILSILNDAAIPFVIPY